MFKEAPDAVSVNGRPEYALKTPFSCHLPRTALERPVVAHGFPVPNGSSHTAASWKLCLDGSKVLTYHAAMETLSRRRFIQTAAGAAALGFVSPGVGAQRDAGFRGPLCFFSKHL